MTDQCVQTIGRYELMRSLGQGSQGVVYLARDPTLDRLVAIKVLNATDDELIRQADDGTPLEARIAGKLKHPNIVPIFDAGHCRLGHYLVFEFVEGQTLSEMLKADGPFTIEAAAPLIAAILKGLKKAHASDILHLDLSPRNILIDADHAPLVMDFGLAQYVDFERAPGENTTGTLRYMSPEHFLGEPLGPWTDVFALGSTFYELVTGRWAMQGSSLEVIQEHIMSADIDFAPIKAEPHGEAFARFLEGALHANREGRYADCSVMSQAFGLFLRESELTEKASSTSTKHSTIDFLMRRMQRKDDFPTISRTLADINRLTGDDANANADKLANVILRDFALTNKLLKLVNSAFHGTRAAEITSISQAVVYLGVEQVRMTANSLSFFGHMKGDSAVLKDSMNKSFLSGLLSRHLAMREKLPQAEEAFICGMCQNLGENLVIYYFAEDFDDINQLQRENEMPKSAASRGVLGVSYSSLGAAVAKSWNLPASIVESIRGLPPGRLATPADDNEKLRDLAVFSNSLCDLFQQHELDHIQDEIHKLTIKFKPCVELDDEFCHKLVNAGFEKLKQFAPIFEINIEKSDYCQHVQSWLEARAEQAAAVSRAAGG